LGGWALSTGPLSAQQESAEGDGALRLAPFRFDVTPPLGHSCCGGWIKPVVAVDDPLEAVGFVLLGAGDPVVICAVDWTGLLNEAHVRWRATLAKAAGTSPERVAVQCVHQHNAPFACLDAEQIVSAEGDLPHIVDLVFFDRCLDTAEKTVRQAVDRAQAVTHVAQGQAQVDRVASNRRVNRDDQGHILAMRGSSCRNAALRALPEGLIDPWLKTVAFYNGPQKLVACHYYATHPMSYYGDGRVSSDFAGLARKRRQAEEPGCLHIYFTGCAGNVAAGKYNDGSPEMRPVLTDRVYQGIVQSEAALRPVGIDHVAWKSVEILPAPRASLDADLLQSQIADKSGSVVSRNRPAFQLAWLRRLQRRVPIVLSSLHINDIRLLHLPGECFVQYQLRAQTMQPAGFVATAAYGDGGPWYVPVREEYDRGGYEPSVAFCDPEIDEILGRGMQSLLA
jgi:hypothetical protein